jgi:hypothetical protein
MFSQQLQPRATAASQQQWLSVQYLDLVNGTRGSRPVLPAATAASYSSLTTTAEALPHPPRENQVMTIKFLYAVSKIM